MTYILRFLVLLLLILCLAGLHPCCLQVVEGYSIEANWVLNDFSGSFEDLKALLSSGGGSDTLFEINGLQLHKIQEAIAIVETFGDQLEELLALEEAAALGLGNDDESGDGGFMYEQPIPCPLGTYCREGVSTPVTVIGDYSTPQPCFDGFFCPPGSYTPEGSGPCPTGHYCPVNEAIPIAIKCPPGHECPGVANIDPTPCSSGSYAFEAGQSTCTLCGVGEICPYVGMKEPLPCTAGYVCDSKGLSLAERECPPSFFCEEGTATSDPDHPLLKAPILCGPGVYCLGGIAHNTTIDWIPTREEGKRAPQTCSEGYYCDVGSSLPQGSGPCKKGHYCPPGSSAPLLVPVGTFSNSEGQTTPTLCSPGSYAPVKGSTECIPCSAGYSCEGYGTYEPRICAPGTYRSRFDSITCKLCPVGTYSPYTGSTSISQCLPCPESRVCGIKGMSNLRSSESCDGGFYCPAGTDRTRQHNHQCPGGHVCGPEVLPESQHDTVCKEGHYCERGTSLVLRDKYKCKQSHYCPAGTSSSDSLDMHCPRQTTTLGPGAISLYDCHIKSVDICDKRRIDPSNIFEDLSYHPYDSIRRGIDQSPAAGSIALHAEDAIESGLNRELLVLRKILPGINSSSIELWKNDTIELRRCCPSYDVISTSSDGIGSGHANGTTLVKEVEKDEDSATLLIVGRNFRNVSSLTCRFQPQFCASDSNLAMSGDCTAVIAAAAETIVATGKYVSPTRIECPRPRLSSVMQSFESHAIAHGSNATRTSWPAAIRLVIDVSNDGRRFSAVERTIPYTSALDAAIITDRKNFVAATSTTTFTYKLLDNVAIIDDEAELHSIMAMDEAKCVQADVYEANSGSGSVIPTSTTSGMQNREQGWYEVRFMRQAHLSFDWRHIPQDMVLDQHYKLSIYARPSRCDDTRCNDRRERIPDKEESPCLQPLKLPDWFTDPSVNKHQVLNMTILALDDALIRVEVQIMDGLYLASADAFLNTMTVHIESPQRAKALSDDNILNNNGEKRRLSPLISWEEREVDMEYFFAARITSQDTLTISPPLNMPPRWEALERGRLLLSMNTTHENVQTPTIKDHPSQIAVTNRFWDHPYATTMLAKEATDAYLETFHGVTVKTLQDNDAATAARVPSTPSTTPGPYSPQYGYDMSDLILPYLPFFSNCRTFDSHIPIWALFESNAECALPEATVHYDIREENVEDSITSTASGLYDEDSTNWWRRQYPALPHRDDVRAVGPSDFGTFYPIADWCERKLYCEYEEELSQTDILPRWFEADTGVSLFSVLRDPINYHQYTGRAHAYASPDDGGGQRHVHSIRSPDTFIPVKVDRSAALTLGEDCSKLCFPRKLFLDVSYYQLNQTSKRIVDITLVYDDFDRNSDRSEYELSARLRPLDYRELIIKFAYSRGIFCLLFVQIGLFTVAMAAMYWVVVRMTTQLASPPKLRFFRMWGLVFPQALVGFLMGIFPTAVLTIAVTLLLRGQLVTALDVVGGIGSGAGRGNGSSNGGLSPVFKSFMAHYVDVKVEPENIQRTVQGRTGLGFLAIGIVCIFEGSKMFIPHVSDGMSGAILSPTSSMVGTVADPSRVRPSSGERMDDKAQTLWRRSNMIYISIVMSLFLVLIVEWSYWGQFGNHIWEAIIFLKILSNFVGSAIDGQLGEALLGAPLMTAMGLVEGLVTLSANDFVDFLLSYIVGFGFLVIDRMYVGPMQENTLDWIGHKLIPVIQRFRERVGHRLAVLFSRNRVSTKQQQKGSHLGVGVWNGSPDTSNNTGGNGNGAESNANPSSTVEPIIDSYCGYCCDTISLFYSPYIILLLILFRNETEMPAIYGIKEQDMEYYILFALLIIPFQIATDVLLHGCLELFHGWRIHDYLVFARYRFLQRETRWKGLDEAFDECIEESVRSLDQHCFSSQWYLMMTVHTSGIIHFVLGVQMMSRARYNLFGDPAMPLIIGFVCATAIVIKRLLLWFAYAARLWTVRKDCQNWHLLLELEELANLQKADLRHAANNDTGTSYEMEQRITSETFRHKFLDYNRSWLIEQLPSLLTPRTQRRSEGYLIPQFSQILNNLNGDISSDSSDDDDDAPSFGDTALDRDQRLVMRSWLEESRDRLLMRRGVEPLIAAARTHHCQRCLSTEQLNVKTDVAFDDVYGSFKTKQEGDLGDQVAFKEFWKREVSYLTLCQKCCEDERDSKREKSEEANERSFPARIALNDSSETLIRMWRNQAREQIDNSGLSDDGEDHLRSFDPDAFRGGNPINELLIKSWLRRARGNSNNVLVVTR